MDWSISKAKKIDKHFVVAIEKGNKNCRKQNGGIAL
jgi:hypothetical protein